MIGSASVKELLLRELGEVPAVRPERLGRTQVSMMLPWHQMPPGLTVVENNAYCAGLFLCATWTSSPWPQETGIVISPIA